MTLKDLSNAVMKKKYAGSSIPEHAWVKTSFSDGSANELTKAVLAYLSLKGHYARRLSSEGRYRPGKEFEDVLGHKKQLGGQWIAGSNTGMADIFVVLNPSGRFLGVEVKYGKDRQGPDQKEFEDEVKNAGGLYILIRTWDDFYFQINKHVS